MLIRATSLCKASSEIRPKSINQLVAFLNADITPIVKDLGVNGDLVSLAQIASATIGLDPCFLIKQNGNTSDFLSKYLYQLNELFYELVGRTAAKPQVEIDYQVAIGSLVQGIIEDLKAPNGRLYK